MQWITWMMLGVFATVSLIGEWAFWSVGNPSEKAKHKAFRFFWGCIGVFATVCWLAGYLF